MKAFEYWADLNPNSFAARKYNQMMQSMHLMCDLFNTQAMQVLLAEADQMNDGRLPVPCRLILDDFAAAARMCYICPVRIETRCSM